jgi:hypothetical protein
VEQVRLKFILAETFLDSDFDNSLLRIESRNKRPPRKEWSLDMILKYAVSQLIMSILLLKPEVDFSLRSRFQETKGLSPALGCKS